MCTCWHVIINSSPTWITVPLLLKVGVTSFLSSYPHSVSGTLHPPCSPDPSSLRLPVWRAVWANSFAWLLMPHPPLWCHCRGLFLCLLYRRRLCKREREKKKKEVLLFAELNFSSIPQRKCLKYIFFVLLCLLYCQLWNIFKTVRCYEYKNTSRFMMGKKA